MGQFRQNWGITRSLYFCQTWKNDFILLEESKNDYERKIKRHKNNLYNK